MPSCPVGAPVGRGPGRPRPGHRGAVGGTLGADTSVASGTTDGRNWSTVNGMTMASGRLIDATTTGTLFTADFSGGRPTGPATAVSGPAVDGRSWRSRALFVLNPPA